MCKKDDRPQHIHFLLQAKEQVDLQAFGPQEKL